MWGRDRGWGGGGGKWVGKNSNMGPYFGVGMVPFSYILGEVFVAKFWGLFSPLSALRCDSACETGFRAEPHRVPQIESEILFFGGDFFWNVPPQGDATNRNTYH